MLAEELLELGGEGVAGGQVGLGLLELVDPLLELAHVAGDVVVGLHHLGHLPLVVGGGQLEVGGEDGARQEARRALHEGERRLRRGRRGHVVGDGGPERRRRDAGLATCVVQDAHDAGRALVARALETEARHQVGIGGRTGDPHRPRVGDVGQQRAERKHHLDAQLARDPHHLLAERPPSQLGLDAYEHDDIALGAGKGSGRQLVGRPDDLARDAVGQVDLGPRAREVVEDLRVDRGKRTSVPPVEQVPARGGGGVGGVVPALEGSDEDGPAEAGMIRPAHMVHRSRSYPWWST